MSFSNEKQVEEILFDAYEQGLVEVLTQRAQKLRREGYSKDLNDIYLEAWKQIRKNGDV